jgi:hypothetical protein
MNVHNGANVTGLQALSGNIARQYDAIVFFHHTDSRGYVEINRGATWPVSCCQRVPETAHRFSVLTLRRPRTHESAGTEPRGIGFTTEISQKSQHRRSRIEHLLCVADNGGPLAAMLAAIDDAFGAPRSDPNAKSEIQPSASGFICKRRFAHIRLGIPSKKWHDMS